jgi:hypothetical protein
MGTVEARRSEACAALPGVLCIWNEPSAATVESAVIKSEVELSMGYKNKFGNPLLKVAETNPAPTL